MNQYDRRDLKRQAREAMRLTRPRFWVVCLIYFLLTTGVESVIHLLSSYEGSVLAQFSFFIFFCTILYNLYYLVIQFGYTLWSLWTWRKLNPGAGSLLQGFSVAGRVIIMELLIFLRIFLWVVLLAMGLTILVLSVPSVPLYLLGILLLYVAVVVIMLRYAAAPYLLADFPDDGASAAVSRSVEMMRGRKWELFKLYVSFLGWELLGVLLTLLAYLPFLTGILAQVNSVAQFYSVLSSLIPAAGLALLINLPLTLWLTPYRTAAEALFYRSILEGRPAALETEAQS